MSTRFSDRHGFEQVEPEISVREDAPENLRYAIAQFAIESGMRPGAIRDVACRILYLSPDRNNWSEYPNIWEEVQGYLTNCPWCNVYDIAEALFQKLHPFSVERETFKNDLNRFFRQNGIGWELTEEGIMYRGNEAFSTAMAEAAKVLTDTNGPHD